VNLRAGVNYLADPYKNDAGIDRSETLFSVGAGYRNSRFFADVAGVFNQFTSSYTPYTVNSPEDFTSARLNTNRNNLVISVGAFF
jgi:long-subunit fatty acid transport protein